LGETEKPWPALVAWVRHFVTYMATKRVLLNALDQESGAFRACRQAFYEYGGPLLARAQNSNDANPALSIDDVMRFAIGVTGAPFGSDEQRERISTWPSPPTTNPTPNEPKVSPIGLRGNPGRPIDAIADSPQNVGWPASFRELDALARIDGQSHPLGPWRSSSSHFTIQTAGRQAARSNRPTSMFRPPDNAAGAAAVAPRRRATGKDLPLPGLGRAPLVRRVTSVTALRTLVPDSGGVGVCYSVRLGPIRVSTSHLL
jgi:hypothetical protein